jgi:general L-amino acid transport system substrate-binding protein
MRKLQFLPLMTFLALGVPSLSEAGTLKSVRDRGYIVCGVSNNVRGFASSPSPGQWKGFDVDFCRAIAAAIFGDDSKLRILPLAPSERFDALKTKTVDVLASNATWTMSRESNNQIVFTGVTYFDQQGFMVPRSRNLVSLSQLEGAKVCMESGTTNESNFTEYAQNKGIAFSPVTSTQLKDLLAAYEAGRCDVITSDHSQLYSEKLELSQPQDHEILKDTISQEPLGPAVRQDDIQWFEIIKWVNFALLNAEALDLSQASIDSSDRSQNDEVKRFNGLKDDLGKRLGLDQRWAYNIVKRVGNYGEILERNLGERSELGIRRTLNKLIKRGGIQFAPPMR